MGTEEMDTEEMKRSADEAPVPGTRSMVVRLGAEFTPLERKTLAALRTRYQQGHDQFSGRELAHMRFLQWLYRGGRLDS